MSQSIQQSMNKTIFLCGILFCLICLTYSCVTDKVDEETGSRTEEEEGMICFKSSTTELDATNIKGGEIIKKRPYINSDWGEITADVSPIDDNRNTKGTPIRLVTNIADAGVMSYVTTSGSFDANATTGTLPNFMYNQKLTQTGGVWSYSPRKYWPLGATSKTSFFAYSPYSTGTNGLTVSASTVTGTPYISYSMPSTAANQPDLLVAPPQINKVITDGAVNFAFKHALAYISFTLQGNNHLVKSIGIKGISTTGNISMDGTTITWSDLGTASTSASLAGINYDAGQTYVTATASQIPEATLMQANGYLMVIPQTLTSSSKIVVTLNDNTTRELAINSITPNWAVGNKYTYNISLRNLVAASNSFILAPGLTYYIDVITRVNQFWGSSAQGGFNNLNGDGYTALGNLSTNRIAPTDQWVASVIWADFAGYTNVSILQTGTAAGGQNGTGTELLKITLAAGTYSGNMVIGIKRSSGGNYLWSFHLWVTNYDPSLSANQVSLPSGRTSMDRNIGATTNTSAATSYGLLYQWGRKDPFLGGSSKTANTQATTVTGSFAISAADAGTLLLSVYNPATFYKTSTSTIGDWITSGPLSGVNGYNRWGGNASNTVSTVSKNTKTIYDPCPTGWRLPWEVAWSGLRYMINFDADNVNLCWVYSGVTPNNNWLYCGYLLDLTGTLVYATGLNSSAKYWSGPSYSDGKSGYDLYFSAGSMFVQDFSNRAYGCPIRPVQDN